MSGNDSLKYAGMSAGIWAVTAYGLALVTGTDISLADVATDAAIMGASAWGSDFIQNSAAMVITPMSSAAGAGLMYAAIQAAYRGDDSYVVNFAAAAANDWVTQTVVPGK